MSDAVTSEFRYLRRLQEEAAAKKTAQPRFRKKRIPVPKRTVESVTVIYKDGKQYTIKKPVSFYINSCILNILSQDTPPAKGIQSIKNVRIDSELVLRVVLKTTNSTDEVVIRNGSVTITFEDGSRVSDATSYTKTFTGLKNV